MKLTKRLTTSRHTSKKNKELSESKKYEQLGRMLASIYESGYINHNQTYKMSFLKGLLTGLGGVIGATLLVAILLWVLSVGSDVPLIDRITEPLYDTIKKGQQK